MCSTTPGTGWTMTSTSPLNRSSREARRSEPPTAAGTIAPTTRERVALTAGLMPGSMPTTGTSRSLRSASAEPAVPVFEPITIAFTPSATRKCAIFRPRSRTNEGGLSPHGAWAESAT